jgi:hypothetical protein
MADAKPTVLAGEVIGFAALYRSYALSAKSMGMAEQTEYGTTV